MKKPLLIVFVILSLMFIFFLNKKNTIKIYVNDPLGFTRYAIDVKLKINDKEILNDTLIDTHFQWMPNFRIEEKLKYGFQKINIKSCTANVNQEEKILLLPYQCILIEFRPADTLTFLSYQIPESMFNSEVRLSDSIIKKYKIEFANANKKSKFFIKSRLKPSRWD